MFATKGMNSVCGKCLHARDVVDGADRVGYTRREFMLAMLGARKRRPVAK
jgi:hypothetical protein